MTEEQLKRRVAKERSASSKSAATDECEFNTTQSDHVDNNITERTVRALADLSRENEYLRSLIQDSDTYTEKAAKLVDLAQAVIVEQREVIERYKDLLNLVTNAR